MKAGEAVTISYNKTTINLPHSLSLPFMDITQKLVIRFFHTAVNGDN
jgi:hypothetical protein